jgi:hypothetical protein
MRCTACCHQKAAECADRDRPRHVGWCQIDEGAARAAAGIVNHHIRRADVALDGGEQFRHVIRAGGVAGKCLRAGLAAQRGQLFGAPGGQRNTNALTSEQPRQ